MTRQLGEWRRRGPRKASSDLAEAVRMLVLDGRLAAGTGLPAERELARALNASRTMIAAALEQLRQAGFVASRRGSGSWITLPGKGMSTPVELEARSRMLDLAHAALPAPRELVAAVDAARAQLPAYLSDHGYHQRGLAVLRQRVARHYERRGLPTAQDQIVITSGAQHAFALVLMLLAGPGDRVVVEQPTYPNTLNAIRAARALPVPVAMTDEGWDLDALDAALRQSAPRLAFLQPDFQNPTGLRMDAGDRRRLVTVLRKNRVPAVIDETTVELDLEGDPLDGPPPTASYGDDAVISIGSASKAYWGGLRLGWIRSPLELVHRLVSARSAIDLGTPVFEQPVLAELLADPEPLLRRRRLEVVERRDALAAAIGEHCPGWTFRNPAGGLCLWCRLDAPVSTRIAVVAEHFGVRVAPGSSFAVYGGLERWLRLPYTQPVEALRDAAQRLSSALSAIGDAEHSSIVDDIIPVA
ncbi:MAG: PLP-dependent aminotransferase family protein [Kutzneria sp.]|nr:PLP-dependent aminotransferase family protein [Kutzneria sp.]